ncbi:hypothetical protein [Fictibacillus barbaricus]|uniref:hypothetical protein n=1 Tax=Fictibacillus barbaricus TaxID=182136 RepID=UPI0016648753|nr:hypothetical protein [Fictibacillus barbaricus]GGB69022.1 hypothetical protein GCM10007199_39020 [Fictibacillus barbaricus]
MENELQQEDVLKENGKILAIENHIDLATGIEILQLKTSTSFQVVHTHLDLYGEREIFHFTPYLLCLKRFILNMVNGTK